MTINSAHFFSGSNSINVISGTHDMTHDAFNSFDFTLGSKPGDLYLLIFINISQNLPMFNLDSSLYNKTNSNNTKLV